MTAPAEGSRRRSTHTGDRITPSFRVGLSADFKTEGAGLLEPVLAEQFDPLPEVAYEFMPDLSPEVTPDHLAGYDAVITLHLRYTAESLHGADRLALRPHRSGAHRGRQGAGRAGDRGRYPARPPGHGRRLGRRGRAGR